MGRANVMEPIHEKNMNQMIALQGSMLTLAVHAKGLNQNLVLSVKNLIIAYKDNKRNENRNRKETRAFVLLKQTQKLKIPIPVKVPSQLAYKKMDESSTILKLPPLLPNKNMKYADESHSAPLTSPNLHHEQEDKILLGTSETTTVVAGSIAKLQGRQILH
ncbi:unnamed protein product [Mytilus edulis]|uniref:Uncharacterized protein n=1 Tax=Mytilus edulis TaxID=6550 RepID=A0A8S3RCM0_MYTED|nr:unnamed protein product [Mytilus edulis]